MIQGANRSENERAYREVMLDSSSSLKMFSQDRKKYFRTFIEGVREDTDEETKAVIIGRLVEVLLWQPELFDVKFYMSACMSAPTGLGLKFVEALYERTKEATNNDGNVEQSFEDISKLAYVDAGYKLPYDTIIKKFAGSDDEIYYNEIRTVRANHLTVVTPKDISNAEAIVDSLKNSFVTRDIVNLVSSQKWTVKDQFQIEGYMINDHPFKSMLDKIIIDHQEKVVSPYDLKCTWNVEGFFSDYYLYRRSYFQAFLYKKACYQLIEQLGLEGYTVDNLKFIVCDSINYYSPLIYVTSDKDMENAYDGFTYNGKYYPGVEETIQELDFALTENIWNISRKNYLNKGIVPLNSEM